MPEQIAQFNRYELKFWIDQRTQRDFLEYLLNFMNFDGHDEQGQGYEIASLYFDTDDLATYCEKYNGDLIRNKFRIRLYDNDPSTVFFEVKRKYNAFVKKSRTAFALRENEFRDIPNLLRERGDEINDDFVYHYHSLGLEPAVWVSYRRIALQGRNNAKLRVTFDQRVGGCGPQGHELRADRTQPLSLSRWNERTVLEIKFDGQFPFWLESAMRDMGLIHESISKYGMALARFRFCEKREQWTHPILQD